MTSVPARTALVLGGARTIGAASAFRLARMGFKVLVADRDLPGARSIEAQLEGSGHGHLFIDVNDEESVMTAFDFAERVSAGIDVLVSCVGGPVSKHSVPPRLADLDLRDWEDTYALNARGTFLVLREMLRIRHRRPIPHARIVTIASIGGQLAWSATGGHYTSSKAAVLSLTKYAATEAAPLGMTVNAIAPGAIDGPGFRANLTPDDINRLVKATPVSRLGSADEVAATVAWLVSEDAGYVTGTTIDVNGGRRMA